VFKYFKKSLGFNRQRGLIKCVVFFPKEPGLAGTGWAPL